MSHSKRYRAAVGTLETQDIDTVEAAVNCLKELPAAKFDETVEVSFALGIDPKKSDQMVRGMVTLPHGTGQKVRVIVFCAGEEAQLARDAGAHEVGGEDLIKRVQQGWLDFDIAISTPEMMKQVAQLGRVLGPRGLMPNPKAGTVTTDLAKAVKEFQSGRVEFKMDKSGSMAVRVGKISFSAEALCDNISALCDAVQRAKPNTAKGSYVRRLFITTTMGPSIRLEASSVNLV